MKTYKNEAFDEERALYGKQDIELYSCRFDGPADGESAIKECKNVLTDSCVFNLRYPFWHNSGVVIRNCEMTSLCRAALWYSADIRISGSSLHGIKALRECADIKIDNCDIKSPEFGWYNKNVEIADSCAEGEYFMMRSENLRFENFKLLGKYSFQYITNSVFENCQLDTKDAFWHAENVVIKNSVIKGEYLAWYCKNVTFENCTIIGTQPLCYCEGLRLINCKTQNADLAFEKSDVKAKIIGGIQSVKNPKSGSITAEEIGEIIVDDENCDCVISTKKI